MIYKMDNKNKIWGVIKVVLVVVVLVLVFQWLMPVLNSPEFKMFTQELGIFGPLVVISYVVVSHILAPLAGMPAVLLGASIFGVPQTIFYIYIAGLISGVINFWISRRFGRKWIIKLAGSKTMVQVDKFVEASGLKLLILSRIFGFALFEVVSYAAGLTKISFKKYFLITLVFSAIPSVIFAFLFKDINLLTSSASLLWIGTIALTGLLFSLFIRRSF